MMCDPNSKLVPTGFTRPNCSDDDEDSGSNLVYTTPAGKVRQVFGKNPTYEFLKESATSTHLKDTKLIEPHGGDYGDGFDDGIYDGVRKVFIGEDDFGISYIKVIYVKDGIDVEIQHGRQCSTHIESVFEVKFPDEYITCIAGACACRKESDWADEDDITASPPPGFKEETVVQLQFKTSHGRISPLFGSTTAGNAFELGGKNGTKLVGLCGRSDEFLDALGARYVFVPDVFKQVDPVGRIDGNSVPWDDGTYDQVKKVTVGQDAGCISFLEFLYSKGDQSIVLSHGIRSEEPKELMLDFEHDEYLKDIEITKNEDGFISSLSFITSLGRQVEFGEVGTTKFTLRPKGFGRLVGFRGSSSMDSINALGANFSVVVAPPVKKLEAKGVDYENEEDWEDWDDGIHESVYKIYVTHDDSVVHAVRFEYVNGCINGQYKTVNGDYHGSITPTRRTEVMGDDGIIEIKRPLHMIDKGTLCFGSEYITSVEGHYGFKRPMDGSSTLGDCYISMLKFKTNFATTRVLESALEDVAYVGTPFCLGEAGHKIVGFHGTSTSTSLKRIGVYVQPLADV